MPHLPRPRMRLWLLLVTALVALVAVSTSPAPARADATSAIQTAYADTGGAWGPLGAATSAETCGLPQGGCTQSFEHGTYYWRESTGAHYVLSGVLATGYAAAGGPSGVLDYPRTDTPACTDANGRCIQLFQNGYEVWTAATGAHAVPTTLGTPPRLLATWIPSLVGDPTSEVTCGLRGGGCVQQFERGAAYLGPDQNSGQMVEDGPIRDAWRAQGAQDGPLGYPSSAQSCDPAAFCAQRFASGDVLISSRSGGVTHLTGAAAGRWWEQGNVASGFGEPLGDTYAVGAGHEVDFQRGSLVDYGDQYPYVVTVRYALSDEWRLWGRSAGMGLPVAAESCGLVGGGCLQRFQNGTIYWSPATGGRAVRFALAQGYRSIREQDGGLGYPVTLEGCGKRGGGCAQEFQGGTELWSPATGALAVRGALRSAYRAQGWENGRLGYPVTNEACGKRSGGCAQEFQGGTELWSSAGGAHSVLGAIRAEYQAQGWENGVLGYPISDEACGKRDGGCSQEFQGGTVLWSPSSGAHLVTGAVRSAYAARGWENSGYGYPVAEPTGAGNGRSAQRFQGGSITA